MTLLWLLHCSAVIQSPTSRDCTVDTSCLILLSHSSVNIDVVTPIYSLMFEAIVFNIIKTNYTVELLKSC